MKIALYHREYNETHLAKVTEIMRQRGAPTIRAIYDGINDMWLAVEGCHRLRAAEALGLAPIIKDITGQRTVRIQMDGDNVRVSVKALTESIYSTIDHAKILSYNA